MANKGKLTKVEKFYIVNSKDSIEEIAIELDRPVKTISKYLEECKSTKPQKSNDKSNTESISQTPNVLDFMVNKAAGGRKGVMAMTSTAAQMADESSAKQPQKSLNPAHTYKLHNKE